MRIVLALLLLLASTACRSASVQRNTTDNPEIAVEQLFTHDGVTVYRFEDGGRAVYFTSRGDVRRTVSQGKTSYPQQTLNGAW